MIPQRICPIHSTNPNEVISKVSFLGVIPKEWKKANVTPVFKKGNRNDHSSYRPVLLTCITCKILEPIVWSKIADHLETYNILCEAQHGFRNRRSCKSQLPLCIDDIAISLDKTEQVDVILLDFQEAFGKVPHKNLTRKLENYGIRGQLSKW